MLSYPPMIPLPRFLLAMLVPLVALMATPRCLRAESSDAAAEAEADTRDWLESYYENPTPGQFVDTVKDWSADGTLDNDHAKPAIIAFASQVMRQNRDRIADWYRDLAGLPPDHMQVIHTAMLFSRTKQADAIMEELFGPAYREHREKTGKILELPLDKRSTLDMLWGYFYATGSTAAIRRIVTCFRFEDAPERPEGVKIPEDYVPLYKVLPDFAESSLIANAQRHPRIPGILRSLLEDDDSLLELERKGIRGVLKILDEGPEA